MFCKAPSLVRIKQAKQRTQKPKKTTKINIQERVNRQINTRNRNKPNIDNTNERTNKEFGSKKSSVLHCPSQQIKRGKCHCCLRMC